MAKRNIIFFLLFFFIALTFVLFSIYFFWQGGPRIRNLNKNLPEGIKVEKRGQEVVINKIENYEIRVPREWGGLKEVEYRVGQDERVLSLEGLNNGIIEIKIFSFEGERIKEWVEKHWKEELKTGAYINPTIIGEEQMGSYFVIKAKDYGGVMGDIYFYYLRIGERIFEFSSVQENSLKQIILSNNFR